MNIRYRQLRFDGSEIITRELADVRKISGEIYGDGQWTRLWFERADHAVLATEVPYGRGRIEIEAI